MMPVFERCLVLAEETLKELRTLLPPGTPPYKHAQDAFDALNRLRASLDDPIVKRGVTQQILSLCEFRLRKTVTQE